MIIRKTAWRHVVYWSESLKQRRCLCIICVTTEDVLGFVKSCFLPYR